MYRVVSLPRGRSPYMRTHLPPQAEEDMKKTFEYKVVNPPPARSESYSFKLISNFTFIYINKGFARLFEATVFDTSTHTFLTPPRGVIFKASLALTFCH